MCNFSNKLDLQLSNKFGKIEWFMYNRTGKKIEKVYVK